MTLFPNIPDTTPPTLDSLLSADFRQFNEYGIAAMHQAYKKLKREDKCKEIEDWVSGQAELKVRIRKLNFWRI